MSITIKHRPLADGSVRWSLYFRPALPDGKSLILVPNATTLADRHLAEAMATNYRKALAAAQREPQAETCAQYFKRWNAARLAKYPRQGRHDEQVFRLWLSDEIGATPIRAVTRDQLIELSHHLDTIAAKGELFGEARARNIYSVAAAMFRDAYSSKDRTLRVLDANPMADAPWPERSDRKALKQLLYPNEFLALVSCPDVPIVRARLYAVTLLTTTRAAEIRVLEVAHVDVAYGNVKITMSDDPMARRATGIAATKSTKSGKSRLVTLEPTLAPVLAAMIKETGAGRLFPDRPKGLPQANQWRPATEEYIPGPDGAYGLCGMFKRDLRAALKWAGIAERPELFDDSDRRASLSIRFHDLRASGITWRHARRDNPAIIRQECGHEDQATNAIYIRALRGLAPAELFPALPARLCEPRVTCEPTDILETRNRYRKAKGFVGAEGLEFSTESHRRPVKQADPESSVTSEKREKTDPGVDIRDRSRAMDRSVAKVCGPEVEKETRPTRGAEDAQRERSLMRLAAMARLLEKLATGDVRVLAGEIREGLEALVVPSAVVVDIGRSRA